MYFHDSEKRGDKELAPGVMARTFWGDRMLLATVALGPHAIVPEHGHPAEQIGIVIEGEITFTIAGETRLLRPGAVYVIPGGSLHSVVVGETAARVVEVFSPVREELQY
jgi:quercetin dioxygenase-like cupin family protein